MALTNSTNFPCCSSQTLAQLKDEENSLLKERRDLKRVPIPFSMFVVKITFTDDHRSMLTLSPVFLSQGIAALRINLEKQIAQNEKLKIIKVQLPSSLAALNLFCSIHYHMVIRFENDF